MRRLVLAAASVLTLAAGARAELAAPQGAVILTVRGAIAETNAPGAAELDRGLLESMGWVDIETHTNFTNGPQRFSGVPLVALLERLGASGDTLHAVALNDYTVDIPVSEAAEYDVLLALDHEDKPMRVRDKGPIWVVYPLAEDEADFAQFDDRMIWQLRTLEVR